MLDLPAEESVLQRIGERTLSISATAVENNDPVMSGDAFDEITTLVRDELDAGCIGKGSCRAAFTNPDWDVVLKLPFVTPLSSGKEQNRVELYVWEKLPIWARDRFFPVTGEQEWVVMEKATRTRKHPNFSHVQASQNIHADFPFIPVDCEFLHEDNMGWCKSNNAYSVLDYGKFIPAQFVRQVLGEEHAEHIGHDNIAGSINTYP